ncbi:MAG: hypothetical protein ABIA02_00495 [Candidatus Falkowbacteria bacterium]
MKNINVQYNKEDSKKNLEKDVNLKLIFGIFFAILNIFIGVNFIFKLMSNSEFFVESLIISVSLLFVALLSFVVIVKKKESQKLFFFLNFIAFILCISFWAISTFRICC